MQSGAPFNEARTLPSTAHATADCGMVVGASTAMVLAATLTHSYLSERRKDPVYGAAPAAPNFDDDGGFCTLNDMGDGTDGVVSMGMCCATSAATP